MQSQDENVESEQPGAAQQPGHGLESPPDVASASPSLALVRPGSSTRWVSSPALRYVVVPCDAIAALCGFYAALLFVFGAQIPAPVAAQTRFAAPLLVLLRLLALGLARLHRVSQRGALLSDPLRHGFALVGATLALAMLVPGLPPAVYLLELFASSALMALTRFGLRFVEVHYVPRYAPAWEGPRRILNIAVAIVGLVVTMPLWVAIAAIIKLTSPGPVFYLQERVGLDMRRDRAGSSPDPRRKHDAGGRPFKMIKFRTMRVDAERFTGAVWSAENDPRVTPIGRFLRHYRLDELPQFINVLAGDMNVVGPRPERPSIFAELRTKIPNYHVRQRARPGITGFAQVTLEYDSCIDDVALKVRCDLEYLAQQGVRSDLRIMARTLLVMLFRSSLLRRGRPAPTPAVSAAGPSGSAQLGDDFDEV